MWVSALKIALKSLYTDNVFVKPVQAVGVLAAATLLQLVSLFCSLPYNSSINASYQFFKFFLPTEVVLDCNVQ